MFDKLLDEFFYEYAKPNPIANDVANNIVKLEDKLIKKLQDEDKDTLLSLLDAHSQIQASYSLDNFKQGFRKGCRFVLDVLCE